jgi:hypothetical protein
MTFHRTQGQTRNCKGCRFWSEMIAQSIGGRPVEALCLAAGGPHAGKYTAGHVTCDSWKSGHLGAVDDPPDYGEATRAAYEAEAGGEKNERCPTCGRATVTIFDHLGEVNDRGEECEKWDDPT